MRTCERTAALADKLGCGLHLKAAQLMQLSERPIARDELYVADGYGNRRILIADAETGRYLGHFGAYGQNPVVDDPSSGVADTDVVGGRPLLPGAVLTLEPSADRRRPDVRL